MLQLNSMHRIAQKRIAQRNVKTPHRVIVGGVCVDERLQIDELHVGRKSVTTHRFISLVGGGGANVALGHRRLAPDRQVSLLANVGDDADGEFIRQQLDSHDIKLPLPPTIDGATSSSAVITEAEGRSTIISFAGVKALPISLLAVENCLVGAEALCLAAHHSIDELPQLIFLARAMGVPVFVGLSSAQVKLGYETLRELFADGGGVDSVMLNVHEATCLCRTEHLDEQLAMLGFDGLVRLAVVTRGANGISAAGRDLAGNDGRWHEPAFSDGRFLVDDTGAGDASFSALIDSLLRGLPVELALLAAARNGWEACTKLGTSACNREQMDAYLDQAARRKAA